jgi:hypothetical protein
MVKNISEAITGQIFPARLREGPFRGLTLLLGAPKNLHGQFKVLGAAG